MEGESHHDEVARIVADCWSCFGRGWRLFQQGSSQQNHATSQTLLIVGSAGKRSFHVNSLTKLKQTTTNDFLVDSKEPQCNPSWKDILEVPISIASKDDFDALPRAKRIAIVSRASVLHLTLLSSLGPLVLRGAIRSSVTGKAAAAAAASIGTVTPGLSFLWAINLLSWHAFHNLVNDLQDLEGDDKASGSFRSDYGCHALKQGFMTKAEYIRLMLLVALPGAVLTVALRNTGVGPAGPWGLSALFLYTILFKPLALGEALIYVVWGPLMGGFGGIAAGASFGGISSLFYNPVTAQFGLAALGVIMGKHTDKINRSEKRTFPKLLGYPYALFATGITILAPHILLAATFLRERVFTTGTLPTIPIGASLAFLTLFKELPGTLKLLRKGQIIDGKPTLPWDAELAGTLGPFIVKRTWPLWFVAACGWHAIVFGYLFVMGSGLEWAGRALLGRLF